MLKLTIVLSESYDDDKQEFVNETVELELEHSLVSLSKWESKHEKPFLGNKDKTNEEAIDYVRCMILTPDFDPEVLNYLNEDNLSEVNTYIEAKMTATWFRESKDNRPNREQITSELMYYWMSSYQIPWEAQYWHLNRLFTLIRVFNAKNATQEKKTPQQIAAERRALNEQRRKQNNTKG